MINISDRDIERFVEESNRIEGIPRFRSVELVEFKRFIDLQKITVDEMQRFVSVYQPDARLRTALGDNVRIGNYFPPDGGPIIAHELQRILETANSASSASFVNITAFQIHVIYEKLHPFTDGNGRSGRMLWYWMMRHTDLVSLGFLHAFYYQTLRNA